MRGPGSARKKAAGNGKIGNRKPRLRKGGVNPVGRKSCSRRSDLGENYTNVGYVGGI